MVQAVIQTTVTGLQGNPVASGTPAAGQSLTWNGTAWAAAGPYLATTGGTLTGPLTVPNGTSTTPGLNFAGATGFFWGGGIIQTSQAFSCNGNLNTGGSLSAAGNAGISGALNVSGVCTFANGVNVSNGTLQTTNNNPIVASGPIWVDQGTATVRNLFFGSIGAPQPFSWFWQWNGTSGSLQWYGQSQGLLSTMDASGNFQIMGQFSTGSDETTKTNIAAVSQGVSLVSQLLPKSFQRIQPPAPEGMTFPPALTQWGFVAQDVQPVIPTAVSQSTNIDGSPGLLSLDTTAITAALVNAVKQLISRVAALESHDGITPTAAQTA